jgi:hypothetical protein
MPAGRDPGWASLDAVRAELDIEVQAQTKRLESADSRAAVLLGAAGAVAALAVNAHSVFVLPGAAAAATAAVLAARVLRPVPHHVLDPVSLRELYVAEAEPATRQAVLDRRVEDFARNDAAIDRRIRRLRTAITTLVVAVALVVAGAAVKQLMPT